MNQKQITIKTTEEELILYFISAHMRYEREIMARGDDARIGDVAKELTHDFIKSFGVKQ